jgi:hypothetical protein
VSLVRAWCWSTLCALLGCSSGGGDGARAGEECSRGSTTAACDTCAHTSCRDKYEAAFHDPLAGDRSPAGVCLDEARCVSHCPCGDGACYDRCPLGISCSAMLFELRNCEAVRCPDECHAALEGVSGACIDLATCCRSPRMPEGFRTACTNTAANGRVAGINGCETVLNDYRVRYDYCD